MAKVKYEGKINEPEKIKIEQGDYIYCKATSGANSFWAIYGNKCGVVALDGAGCTYIPEGKIYLGEHYNYWLIEKRIPCDKAMITIEEIER